MTETIEIKPPLVEWQRPKMQRYFAYYGYTGTSVAARITDGPNWWSLDDTMADAARAHTPDAKLTWLSGGNWRLIPRSALPDVVKALGHDVSRLRVRELTPGASA